MKHILFPASLLALALAAVTANAAIPTTYMLNGKILSPDQALMAALDQKPVMGCKPVEAKVSKTGSSIALRAKKTK